MDCHKPAGNKMKEHALSESGESGEPVNEGTPSPFDLPKKHIIMRRAATEGPEGNMTEPANETSSSEEDIKYNGAEFNNDVCKLAKNTGMINLHSVPQAHALDPMNFTISGYACEMTGFATIEPLHTNCTPVGDHMVFYGHFEYEHIQAVCDCGHEMTDYRWLVQVNMTGTELNARVHKHSGPRFMYFYDTATYTQFSEVAAPMGKEQQIRDFLRVFHEELRGHFEMAYTRMADILLKIIASHM